MIKFKLYLDTSVWNFYNATDAPEKMQVTRAFFNKVKSGEYEIYSSAVVVMEIENAGAEIKKALTALIKEHSPIMLDIDEEIDSLAEIYMMDGIIPKNKRADAMHIAVSTAYELDALVSWNYRHLANLNKKEKVRAANILQGYLKELEMVTPMEVIGDE
jgi:predicted nucleic acid-binding protein